MAGRTATRALLLLLLAAPLRATAQEPAAAEVGAGAEAAGPRAGQVLQPTRQSIYAHLAAELQAALGAEEHVRGAFAGAAQGLRETLRESVVPRLQALVDGVVERAEDAWVAADEAGRTLAVKPCVDSAEGDAQQVVKRALEKAEGCVKAVEEEGALRVREAARLLNEIEGASKGLVTALEACIKEEEAKEAQAPDAAPASTSDAAAAAPDAASSPAATAPDATDTRVSAPEAPGQCPKAAGEACTAEKTAAPGDGRPTKCKGCASGCKCKKAAEGESPKDKTREEDVAQGEEITADETKDTQPPKEAAGKYENEQKGKKGKEWKENKVKDGGKEKGKYKKFKDGEPGKEGVRADKRSKNTEPIDNLNSESSSGEGKEKKGKKESKGKKEKSAESAEGRRGRQKRDLLGFNESPEEDIAAPSSQQRPPAAEVPSTATEGASPEERRVIACMRSAALQPLVEQKTRAYQRLQAVLQRTAARQQDAPACVTDHLRKAELKVAAIQQRMASCADRKMREEL
ncbi:hypothetical protein R5R35_007632 [Gryllus longicercus]|uniref:Uncharacterized protein n=1 Tax=Gryllus longicercus TaxID=2509291 RepID=A0AAN9VA69_9ORTH